MVLSFDANALQGATKFLSVSASSVLKQLPSQIALDSPGEDADNMFVLSLSHTQHSLGPAVGLFQGSLHARGVVDFGSVSNMFGGR